MRVKGNQIYIALVCLIMGIMFAVEYNASSYYKASLVPSSIEDLNDQLKQATLERDKVEKRVAQLNDRLENKRSSNQRMADIQRHLQLKKMAGGLYPCQGPGISLTITYNGFQSNNNTNGSYAEATELLGLVNELKASGAEAVSINDQRITAMSEIYWTGTMIVVNEKQIRSPYHIQAIGDPENLESGMLLKGGYLDNLPFQQQISMKKLDQIVIPAYNGPIRMNFVKPVK